MKKKKNNVNNMTIISIIIVLLVLFLSIGWSSLNTGLHLESMAMVRITSDIRVTGFFSTTGNNGGTSVNEDYNVDSLSGTINLPNSNSTVTYRVEITNMELAANTYMGINGLTGLPSNLKILDITDYTLKDKICDDNNSTDCGTGAQKTFYITIGYKNSNLYDANNTSFNFIIDVEFKKVFDIIYSGFTTPPLSPTTVMDGEKPIIVFNNDAAPTLDVISGGATLVLNTNYSYSNHLLSFLTAVRDHVYIHNPTVYSITYNLDGGKQANNQITSFTIGSNQAILSPTKTGYVFGGWYLNSSFTGNDITNTSQLSGNTTLYAYWVSQKARIGSTYYNTLAEAVADVTGNGETTVELLSNTNEIITVNAGQNIIFDLKDHTLGHSGSNSVITNSGHITIINGTISCNTGKAAIENNANAVLTMTGGKIEAKNTKQAINNAGNVTISGNATLTSTSNQKATIQNLSTGTLTVLGGTISSTRYAGIENAGVMTIGDEGSGVSTSSPAIRGETYGILSSTNFDFYDGRIGGVTLAVNDETKIDDVEDNFGILHTLDSISNTSYNTIYLAVSSYQVTFNANGGTASVSTKQVEPGAAIGVLPTAQKTGFVFDGWYDDDHDGHQISDIEVINSNITFYAHWIDESVYYVARIGNNGYLTFDSAWQALPDNTQTTIEILRDIPLNVKYTVSSNKNVIIDLSNHTIETSVGTIFENNGTLEIDDSGANGGLVGGLISGNTQVPVVVNKSGGTVTLSGGSISSRTSLVVDNSGTMYITGGHIFIGDVAQGVLNNNQGATLYMSGGTITGTRRQAIYNNGTLTISGNSVLTSAALDRPAVHNASSGASITISGGTITSSNTSCNRGAVQNVSGGNLLITGGTISSTANSGVQNAGILELGYKDGIINSSSPDITGGTYGVNNSGTFRFYDGIIRGKTKSFNGNLADSDPVGTRVNTTDGDYRVTYFN